MILRGEIEEIIGDPKTAKKIALPLATQEIIEGGNSGETLLFKYPFTGRLLAIKKIKEGAEKSEDVRNRLRCLLHPNLSVWHGMGTVGEEWKEMAECYTFVPGRDIKKTLKEQAAKPEFGAKQRLQIILDMINGALALHEAGLFHRDMKPANAIISPIDGDGLQRAMLIDYGLVIDVDSYRDHFLKSKVIPGTALFMPPYTFGNNHADVPDEVLGIMLAKRDGYAIGQTAIEMFGGLFKLIDKNGSSVKFSRTSSRSYQSTLIKTAKEEGQCRVDFKKRPPWARPDKRGLKDRWEGKVKLRRYFNGGRFSLENLTTLINGLMSFDLDTVIKLTAAKERVEEMLGSLR